MMLTTKEAAKYLGISYYYLRNLRHEQYMHEGPRYVTGKTARGKTCFYYSADLDLWSKQNKWRVKR